MVCASPILFPNASKPELASHFYKYYCCPLSLVEKDIAGANPAFQEGGISIMSLLMMQNQNALIAWDTMFRDRLAAGATFGRIIEIGTCHGGFITLLGLFAFQVGCRCITYDIDDKRMCAPLMERVGVEFRLRDCFAAKDEIIQEIEGPNTTVLFCDGGDHLKEFLTFAPYLKPNDVILAHDYAPNETLKQVYRHKVWSFVGFQDKDIEDCCQQHDLQPYLADVFSQAATVCRIRKSRQPVLEVACPT